VKNTGKRTGKAVPQVYVSPKDPKAIGGWEAPQRLAGFKKVELAPGATTKVTLTVDPRLLATWNEKAHGWSVAPATTPSAWAPRRATRPPRPMSRWPPSPCPSA
jgi:hypothetical protein